MYCLTTDINCCKYYKHFGVCTYKSEDPKHCEHATLYPRAEQATAQTKYIEVKEAPFGSDLNTKDLRLSDNGNQLISVNITRSDALRIAGELLKAAGKWDQDDE